MESVEIILLIARACFHLGTFWLIFNYEPDDNTQDRPRVSLLAIALALPSLLLGGRIALFTLWQASLTTGQLLDQFLTLVLAGGLFAAVWLGRGNVATLLPRRVWSHRP